MHLYTCAHSRRLHMDARAQCFTTVRSSSTDMYRTTGARGRHGLTLGTITIDFEDHLVLCGVATEAPEGVPLGIRGGEVQQRVLVLLCAHRQGNVAHTRM